MDVRKAAADVRYFEDYAPGLVVECGTVTIDEDAIVTFAGQFDPQEFHTDPALAADGPFGGLIASGWHTASLMTRLVVTRYLSGVSSLGSPGIDELRWTAPVRPGDALSVRVTVLAARLSRSKPDRGLIHSLVEVRNQDAELVLALKLMNLIRCRRSP